MFEELNLPLSREEILNAIKQLKNNKGPGQDKMINKFFIHGVHILLPYLDTLFNTIFNHGYSQTNGRLEKLCHFIKKEAFIMFIIIGASHG